MAEPHWGAFNDLIGRGIYRCLSAKDKKLNRIWQAVEAIKQADLAVRDIVNPIRVEISQVTDKYMVHVNSKHDLDQIPGSIEYFEIPHQQGNYYEASKTVAGIKFFCLVRQKSDESENTI